jgi:replicative DNA helicase
MVATLIPGQPADDGFAPLPPHNTEAEESVLGSLLMDPEAIEVVAPILSLDDWYHPRNRDTYAAMLHLRETGQPTDFVMVCDELERTDMLDHVGGVTYLTRLLQVVPTSIHAEHYAQIVYRTAMSRRMISLGGRIAALGYDDIDDVGEMVRQAEQELAAVTAGARAKDRGPVPLRDLLVDYLESIQLGADAEAAASARIPSGYFDLDRILGGMARGDLVILAARPSVGKTALAMGIARNAAVRFNVRTLLFSVEMSGALIAQRFLSMESGVDSARIREGRMSDVEVKQVGAALDVLQMAPIWVDDTPQIALTDLCGRARKLASAEQLDLVIVDYLGLVRAGRGGLNRVQEISEISGQLKGLARELNVPVLVLSQLNRAVEQRHPHIPMLSDLRESGAIEQDADVVLFLYREDLYDRDSERKGITDVIIAKHRNGPTGLVSLLFLDRNTRFVDLEHQPSVPGF